MFTPDYNSEASSFGEINIPESSQSTQHHEHIRKWTDSHPLDNIIGNPSRPVSTRKQLAMDALWCFYNSVLSKVEPKNFQSASTKDYWFQAMQDEIHEFDRLDVWELVPPPDSAMIIALKWIYKYPQLGFHGFGSLILGNHSCNALNFHIIASEVSLIVSSSNTPTVSGQVTNSLAVCALYNALAIVMKLALVAHW
ncbi:retrovirus-related pol polyprotein from transposon TNT 1-94 [Tanacetum coccineum]